MSNEPCLTLPAMDEVSASIVAWGAAEPKFGGMLKAGVPAARALKRWALELLRVNRISEGLTVFRAALALSPDDATVWTNYGVALSQGEFLAEAVAVLERSLTLSRGQPDAWLMLGLVRRKQSRLPDAEIAFQTALEFEPGSSVAWSLLGVVKEEQGDFTGAAACLVSCIKAGGANAATLANLGKLYQQLGRLAECAEAFRRASNLEPGNAHYRQMALKSTFLHETLDSETLDGPIANYQNSFAPEGRPSPKDLIEMLDWAFIMLGGFGHLAPARRVGARLAALAPARTAHDYLRKALEADRSVACAPPRFVVEHFDAFADRFETQLVGALGYDIPRKICEAVRSVSSGANSLDTLDAGCGTGLCGLLLRPISRTLTGVDLSPRMLAKAGEKSVYDKLECEELTAFLIRSAGLFDLIVAADTLIYFGDLAPVFAAAAAALRLGGLFAFSAELWAGQDYRLQPSGRFAHAPAYVRQLASAIFAEVTHVETTIRLEGAARLPGFISIFRRRD